MINEGETVVTRRLCVATGEILDGSIPIPEHLVAGRPKQIREQPSYVVGEEIYGRSVAKRLAIIFAFCEQNKRKLIQVRNLELEKTFVPRTALCDPLRDRLLIRLTSGRGIEGANGWEHQYRINLVEYEKLKSEYPEIYSALLPNT